MNNIDEINETNKNTITYANDWQNVSQTEYPAAVEYDEDLEKISVKENRDIPNKKKDSPRQLLLTLQLVICIAAALAAFAVKSIGGEIYSAAREWYYQNLNSSVIFDNDSQLSLENLFGGASSDEAKNS